MAISGWKSDVDVWLGTHHGVISRSHLMQFGCSRSTIDWMVDAQRLRIVLPGIYLSTHWQLGHVQRMVAACLRNPQLAIAFTTAGRLWVMRRMSGSRATIHVLVPHGRSPELRGIVVHRCRRIDPVDIVERADGIRLTSPPRTLFDCADMLGAQAAESVLEQLLDDERCTFATVLDTVDRLAHPRRPGSRTMWGVLASRPAWREALQSDLELRVLNEVRRQRLPAPVAQFPVLLPTGVTIHLDFGWPAWKVGVEVDHPTWHAARQAAHRDKHRDRKAATVGWRVARITDLDVNHGLAEAIADVAAIINRARRHAAA